MGHADVNTQGTLLCGKQGVESPLRNRSQTHWQVWTGNVIVLALASLLMALAANWITISNPFVAAPVVVGLVLVLPGWLILSLANRSTNWAQRVGMAPVVSLGMWSIPGLILLFIHSNIKVMLGIIVGVTLTLGALFVRQSFRTNRSASSGGGKGSSRTLWSGTAATLNGITLIVAICLLMSLYVSTVNVGHTDRRNYEKYIRNYVESDNFLENMFVVSEDTPLPVRGTSNTWNLLVAVLIKLTHLDLFEIYNFYLVPALMVLGFFGFYTLAYELFRDSNTAWFATSLQTLYLSSGVFPHPGVGYGLEWLFRVQEDKFALWFIFLPGALAVTGCYLFTGRKSWLLTLGICLFGIAVVHPIGLIYYGMAFGGYAIFELIVFIAQASRRGNVRRLAVDIIKHPLLLNVFWATVITALAFILPLAQRQSQMANFSEVNLESKFFEVVEDKPGQWLRALGNGEYVVDRAVLDNQFIVAAFLMTPWLVFRGIKSFPARFLAAGMVTPILLVFTPLTPLIGRLITTTLLWRLLWIMPVALVLTFVLVDFIRWLQSRQVPAKRAGVSVLLPLVLWVSTLGLRTQIAATAETLWEFFWTTGSGTPSSVSADEYALFEYMRTHIQVGSTVFADPAINFNIPGLLGRAYGVTYSNYPPRLPRTLDDVDFFFSTPDLTGRHIEILRLHDARYLVLPVKNLLYLQFASLGTASVEIYRNEDFGLFELDSVWETSEIVHHTVTANDLFRDELCAEATRAYERILAIDPTNVWASVMLGDIYRDQGLYEQAQDMYERAIRHRPDAPTSVKLGGIFQKVGQFDLAEAQYRYAQEIEPDHMPAWENLYRLLGDVSQADGHLEQAVRHYREAVAIKRCGNPPAEMVMLRDRYLPSEWPIVFRPPVSIIRVGDWVSACSSSSVPASELTSTYALINLTQDIDVVLENDPTEQLVRKGVFVIQDMPKAVLFQHPPSQISFAFNVIESSSFRFSLAISPEVWQLGKGDGVQFDVYIDNGDTKWHAFSEYIDPKNVPGDRRWHDHEIDLSPWAGQTVALTLVTNPGPNGDDRCDWAGWGEARIVQPIAFNFLTELPNADHGGADEQDVRQDTITIDHERRVILFQHPPNRVTYHVEMPEQARLHFGLGLDPAVWSPAKGDGVEYNIYVRRPAEPLVLHRVFHSCLDPKNDPGDRHWLDQVVNLTSYGGETIDLIFEALPGPAGDANFDWGGWSHPVLVTGRSVVLGTDSE